MSQAKSLCQAAALCPGIGVGAVPIAVPPLASPRGRVFPRRNPESSLDSTLPSMMVGSGKEEPSLARSSDKKRNPLARYGFVVVLNKYVF